MLVFKHTRCAVSRPYSQVDRATGFNLYNMPLPRRDREPGPFGLVQVVQNVGGGAGRGGVLAGDQLAVGDRVNAPVTVKKVAPRLITSSSTGKGTTLVKPTSCSPSVKPVTFLPLTSDLPTRSPAMVTA